MVKIDKSIPLCCLVNPEEKRWCKECQRPICIRCCHLYGLKAPTDFFVEERQVYHLPEISFGWFHWDCLPYPLVSDRERK